jgi:hypothetical protein
VSILFLEVPLVEVFTMKWSTAIFVLAVELRGLVTELVSSERILAHCRETQYIVGEITSMLLPV